MKPRLGFLGVGWIGRNRLEAVVQSGRAEVVAVADPSREHGAAAANLAQCRVAGALDELLSLGLDGMVIATPSALHAEQACAALESGVAVFCQKPLGRTADETRRVVETARRADKLLGVDLSYRFVEGARLIRRVVQAGELGRVYAADLVFHNAYGPDKAWFYDPSLSGGGCVIDLGIHLVDLVLWTLDGDRVASVSSHLFAKGQALTDGAPSIEDFALAELGLSSGAVVRIACSWNLPAGSDAVIQAAFYGTDGGARLSNVGGSFYDFAAERFRGTSRERLCSPPDAWGGRAIVDWLTRLGGGAGYDRSAERLVEVASVLDRVYGRASGVPAVVPQKSNMELIAGYR